MNTHESEGTGRDDCSGASARSLTCPGHSDFEFARGRTAHARRDARASTADDGLTRSPPWRWVSYVPEDSASETSLPRSSTGGTDSSSNAMPITSAPNESEQFNNR